jgi:hypothetical protein
MVGQLSGKQINLEGILMGTSELNTSFGDRLDVYGGFIDLVGTKPVLYHSLAEIGMDLLIAELGRRGQDISSLFKRLSKRRSGRHHFGPIWAIITQSGCPLAHRKRSG